MTAFFIAPCYQTVLLLKKHTILGMIFALPKTTKLNRNANKTHLSNFIDPCWSICFLSNNRIVY